ncbi:MAG: hypothetical protein K2F53_01155 [Rikenellaceae bacterium]|nr:hypothetical protein [Rikenellaceae bacterium]
MKKQSGEDIVAGVGVTIYIAIYHHIKGHHIGREYQNRGGKERLYRKRDVFYCALFFICIKKSYLWSEEHRQEATRARAS